MFFTEEKLAARIDELAEYRYRDPIEFPELRFLLDSGEIGKRAPEDGEWSAVTLGEHWQGRDLYAWIAVDAAIPEIWQEKIVVGRFDFGSTGGGHNSGFESLLFLNDTAYQGVDSNHQEVFFPQGVGGQTLTLRFRLWSGLEGGGKPTLQDHTFRRAEIACFDEDTDDFFFSSKAVLDTLKILEKSRPEKDLL
ncbi:MAG: alpha-mannosidase, partial [bacterium]|nr:alpha-mannosidase [bacterium]